MRRLRAEAVFWGWLALAGWAVCYDLRHPSPHTVSERTLALSRSFPITVAAATTVFLGLLAVTCRAWGVPFRWGLALVSLGVVIGHLFWCQ